MRDKQLGDRYTREEQEKAWVSVMHGQAPPYPKRAEIETATGMIPLAPMVDSTSSPLVAARAAAAASLSWSSNAGAYQYQHQHPPTLNHNHHVNPHLPAPAWSASSRSLEIPSIRSAMVKLDKPQPLPAALPSYDRAAHPFPFASAIAKPAPASSALLELLPKRKREDEFFADPRDTPLTSASAAASGSKRACLPKKCDFPMCKNSSRSRGFCYSHGGGRRCRVEGCSNGAVSRDLCKRHGGGRRCRVPGCKSSSESGGLCYSHGGGRRCSLAWCNARAKKGGFCAVHLEHRDATPPPESEAEAEASTSSGSSSSPSSPSSSNQVVETLLALSKSPKEENEEVATVTSPRKSFALSSILN